MCDRHRRLDTEKEIDRSLFVGIQERVVVEPPDVFCILSARPSLRQWLEGLDQLTKQITRMATPLRSLGPAVCVDSIDQCTARVLPSEGCMSAFSLCRRPATQLTIAVIMVHFSQDVDRIAREWQVWRAK
jgi:hypothetical protein